MTVFLTSSPCIYGAPRAILNPENEFIDNLRRRMPKSARCLFVCSDPDDTAFTDRVAQEMGQAFAEAGFVFSDIAILDRRTDEDAQMMIWSSDFILLFGGHVPTQNAYFQEIGLGQLLENYQGILMGISAGTMNAAGRVYAQPEEPGESDPDFERFLPGLGITDVNVLPHYQQVKDYTLDGLRLFEDITFADSWGECFFVLVDGSYLLIEDRQTALYGEAYTLHDGQMTQISASGDILILE